MIVGRRVAAGGLALIAGAILLFMAVRPSDARAVIGELEFAGCVEGAGAAGCVDPPNGSLVAATDIALSPDGDDIYVRSSTNSVGALTHFSRAADGTPTFVSCVAEGGAYGCVDPAEDALTGVGDIAISPDGDSLYAAASIDDAISRFNLAANGVPTYVECIAEAGGSGCADPATDSLDAVTDVVVSPDDGSVYAVAQFDDALTHYSRAAGGALTFQGCIADGGASGCTDPPLDSLDLATSLALSPEGDQIYVAAGLDASITWFDAGVGGAPGQVACVANTTAGGCTDIGPDVLATSRELVMSPDGASVYVASGNIVGIENDEVITRLRRTPADGQLAFDTCFAGITTFVEECSSDFIVSIAVPAGLGVSPDSRDVYVGDGILGFNHFSTETGALTYDGCYDNNGEDGCADIPRDSLGAVAGVAASPDGRDLYTASNVTASTGFLTHFKRDLTPPPAYEASPDPPAQPPPAVGDTTPPESEITRAPKRKVKTKRKSRKATFTFTSNEPGSSFECSIDGAAFAACVSPLSQKVKLGAHTFAVRATDAAGNVEATPATTAWKLKRKAKR